MINALKSPQEQEGFSGKRFRVNKNMERMSWD